MNIQLRKSTLLAYVSILLWLSFEFCINLNKFCHILSKYAPLSNSHLLQFQELDAYEALVDVRCYELVTLLLCSLFVPKCSSTGTTVPPCRSLCTETMRRCGFFFEVFGLELPEYIKCHLFAESNNPDECVGSREVQEAKIRSQNPTCSGFMCDKKRCIPSEWKCDGHVDCNDQTDESDCVFCPEGSIYCGERRCMSQKHVCDGIQDCPYGQDERNCSKWGFFLNNYCRSSSSIFSKLNRVNLKEMTWDN